MVLLILGGNSDIGLAIAGKFAKEEKAEIVLASRNKEELDRNASDLSIRFDVDVHTYFFDACDVSSHKKFYEDLKEQIDGVVLAFGYNGDQKKAGRDVGELKRIIDTNLTGAASILEVVSGDFEQRDTAAEHAPFIIGISSIAGERGRMKNYIYGSAKAGLTAILSGLRQRLLRNNIRVITVKPGFVMTKMTETMDLPQILTLTPEQVAKKTYKAYKNGTDQTCITFYWWGIMTLLNMLPERLYKRLKI